MNARFTSTSSRQIAAQVALHQRIMALQGKSHKDYARHQQDVTAMKDEITRRNTKTLADEVQP
jgi:hypothetical protein